MAGCSTNCCVLLLLLLQGEAEYMGVAEVSTARQPLLVPMVMGSLAAIEGPVKVGCATVLELLLVKVAGEVGPVALAGADSGAPLYVTVVPLQVKLVA